MTDKQIIIDGVDVAGCERHCSDNYNTPNMCYSDMTRGYRQCNPKENQCDFYIVSIEKQLARKTQECNELKEEIEYSHNQNIRWAKAWTKMWRQRNRYKQALEGLVENERTRCNKAKPLSEQILSIINEGKDAELGTN